MPRNFEGVIAVEGAATGDGRYLERGFLTWDDGPWPLLYRQPHNHDQGQVVGQLTRVWRDGDLIRGEGVIDTDSANPQVAADAARLVELLEQDTPAIGVSIGWDEDSWEIRVDKATFDEWQAEMEAWMNGEVPEPEDPEVGDDGRVVLERFAFDDFIWAAVGGRLRELSVVPVGAVNDARIQVEPEPAAAIAASLVLVDSIALVASLSVRDRAAAFQNPNFGRDGDIDPRLVWQEPERPDETAGWGCPLTITDAGELYGHAAIRNRCHGSLTACLPAPTSGGDFSRFLIGEAVPGVATGPITLAPSHGVDEHGRVKSATWLADTGSAVADVACGWDQHGLWVAGRLRPGITEREEATLRGSTLSGEWHPIGPGGKLRLIGILAVNGPGYLVQRRGVAASFTYGPSCCGPDKPMTERLAILEGAVADLLRRG